MSGRNCEVSLVLILPSCRPDSLPTKPLRTEGEVLSRFLSDVFPQLIDPPYPDQCWVTRAIRTQHLGLNVLSEALQVVDQYGTLGSLETKLKREHPVNGKHNRQYDERVLDCLTEACAFAWASLRGLGFPKFSDRAGTPDILLDSGRWVEVKAIHSSQEDAGRTRLMLAGEVVSGSVTEPAPGLYGKFTSSTVDSIKKFARQTHSETPEPNIVFFNLTSLDVPQIAITDTVLVSLNGWAEGVERTIRDNGALGDVKLAMCYGYNWKAPFRDPFGV